MYAMSGLSSKHFLCARRDSPRPCVNGSCLRADEEQALNLSYRNGDYGLLSIGMVTEVGYRFGLGAMTTNLGAEAWVKFAGLRLDAVLESAFVERQYAPGIGYRLTVGLGPALSASVGGQTLYGRGTELVIGLGFAFLGPKSKEKPGKTKPD